MIRSVWFILKLSLVVMVAVWIAERPGRVQIEWMDYTITVHFGLFLLALAGVVFIAAILSRLFYLIVDMPWRWRQTRARRRLEKGYKSVTMGLAAIVSGDDKAAVKQAARAARLLPAHDALLLLLQAQSAKISGKPDQARVHFAALAKNRDAGFLGLRGLVQDAVESGKPEAARSIIQGGLKKFPRQKWLLTADYDMALAARDWAAARGALARAARLGAVDPARAASDRIALMIAESDDALKNGFPYKARDLLRAAWRHAPGFAPAAIRLASVYRTLGRERKAAHIIARSYQKNPHPDLAAYWEGMMPPQKPGQKPVHLAWAARLAAMTPDHAESHIVSGRAAMLEGLWGEARACFQKAEAKQPSARLYKLWTELEGRMGGSNARLVENLRIKSSEYPVDKTWFCRAEGEIYPAWQPVSRAGHFNAIVWDYPVQPAGTGPRISAHAGGAREDSIEALLLPRASGA